MSISLFVGKSQTPKTYYLAVEGWAFDQPTKDMYASRNVLTLYLDTVQLGRRKKSRCQYYLAIFDSTMSANFRELFGVISCYEKPPLRTFISLLEVKQRHYSISQSVWATSELFEYVLSLLMLEIAITR